MNTEQLQFDTSCLHSLVGIKDFQEHPCETGIYIDDMAGITVDRAASLCDPTTTGKKFLSDKIKQACMELGNDMPNLIGPSYRVNGDLEAKLFGVDLQKVDTTGTFREVGMTISRNRPERMTGIRINSVALFFSSSTPDFLQTVTISDGINSKEVSISVSGKSYPVNFFSTAEEVTITYVEDNTTTYGSDSIGASRCRCSRVSFKYMGATGYADGTDTGDESYGLSVSACYTCDESRMLCAIRHRLTFLVLYKSAILVMTEMYYSTRSNSHMLDKERMEKLLVEFKAEYEKRVSVFMGTVKQVLNSISSNCIICKGSGYAEVNR
jgi:hypothetical protein